MVRAEQRLRDLGIELPQPPKPLGAYVEAMRTGKLLYLSGMLPVHAGVSRYVGRIGGVLNAADGRDAARIAALNGLAVIRHHLGSLDKVARIVSLRAYVATEGDFRDHAAVADGASELLVKIFGQDKASVRMVLGVASLPLGSPVAIELTVEVED